MRATGILLGALAMCGLAACSSPGDDAAEDAPPATGRELGSRNFLQFLNRQPALAAGDYTLVAATAAAGQSGSYTLTLTFDDGGTRRFTGNWSGSGGPDASAIANPRHGFTLSAPGGLVARLDTPIDGVLFLLDRTGAVVAQDDNGGGGTTARIALAESRTNDTSYARAYYATIDPQNEKDTLPKWKAANGFDTGEHAAAVFLDTKDLGYGRNMHMRRGAGGRVAFYVDNYQVRKIPGQAYSAINLDAAVDEIRDFHVGTNALEFGPVDTNADGIDDDLDGDGVTTADRDDYVVQFFAFDPTPPYARRLAVDMDGFGGKGMPVPCITCHGGRADPLLPDGAFPRRGDTRGHLQPIDVDTLGFSAKAGATRAEMEVGLKAFNCEVFKSYEPDLADRAGRWNSALAREMLAAWYGGDPCAAGSVFSDTYVPAGWVHDAGTGFPPQGSEALYRDVIADHCRACHLLRGTRDNPTIDFTGFDRFIGYAPQIEPLVFDSGRMPLAFVPYRNLFDAEGAIGQLASFLPDFSRVGPDGAVLRPGRPIANAGPDRRAPSPVAISGIASRQATSYAWRIVAQPPGSVASLDAPASVRTRLSADTDGVYELELAVGEDAMTSRDRVLVTIDGAISPAPSDLRFETDIKPVLQGVCVGCHKAGGNGSVLPSLFYTDPAPGENRDLYVQVRARIDFNDPTESLLLTKPGGRHHAGGLLPGFDPEGDRVDYDTFLAWILEGAPRGP